MAGAIIISVRAMNQRSAFIAITADTATIAGVTAGFSTMANCACCCWQ